jgi:SAM-dependent methyltransferase
MVRREFESLITRKDMAQRQTELWRPPLFSPPDAKGASVLSAIRRFFDLQAGSLWRDLTRVLPAVRGRVLDIGCGAQPYRRLLSSEAKYIGIDILDAKSHFGYEMPDTTYFSGAAWPVLDGSVDFALSTETLEHVLDPRHFLAEARRCLAPGGTLMLSVPFAARWHFIPYDYWRFTPSSLRLLLNDAGFPVVHVYARGNALTVACYKVMALILKLAVPQAGSGLTRLALRLAGLLGAPLFCCLAAVANLSLIGNGGDDCLGYTVIAS